MINVSLDGGDAAGASAGYWIEACGWSDRIPGGQDVCVTGPGPINVWYGKKGGNENVFTITQIPSPTYPPDDSVRIGCALPLHVYGLENVTWTVVDPAYQSWINTTNPNDPVFTPGFVPASGYVEYQINGDAIATCTTYVETHIVRIYVFSEMTISTTGPGFCEGSSAQVTATATGGSPAVGGYTYWWTYPWLKKYLEYKKGDVVASMLLASCNSIADRYRDTTLYDVKLFKVPNFTNSFSVVEYQNGIVFTGDKQVYSGKKENP